MLAWSFGRMISTSSDAWGLLGGMRSVHVGCNLNRFIKDSSIRMGICCGLFYVSCN